MTVLRGNAVMGEVLDAVYALSGDREYARIASRLQQQSCPVWSVFLLRLHNTR